MVPADLRARVEEWIADDPDPTTRAELQSLLAADDVGGLEDRFAGLLSFGTAGLRGAVGAGPNRMNVAVVRRAALALAGWLDDAGTDRPVVIGRDARHGSAEFLAATVDVLTASGRDVVAFDGVVPTPVVAFAAADLDAAAAVVVTASHNPPTDNGYKVYGAGGAQIVPPDDEAIAQRMRVVATVRPTGMGSPASPVDPTVVARYLDGVAALRVRPEVDGPLVAYTAMHGVGGPIVLDAFERAGFARPEVVADQFEPDPDFPTVRFPNPEEPGAMDLVLALGTSIDADLVLANDPDADRLAAAVPDGAGGWRVLSGDEVGVLLADHLLRHTTGDDRLCVTTVVSSSMLAEVAAAHGATFVETLTGFKWLADAARRRPALRPIIGYEEALGYSVGSLVADKDGISAAVVFAELVAALGVDGSGVRQRLDELAVLHGLHATKQRTWRFEGVEGPMQMATAVDRLRAEPPAELAGRVVTETDDLARGGRLPPTDAVVLRGADFRVVVRPSGTEPKLKAYAELVVDVDASTVTAARAAVGADLDDLLGAVGTRLG